MHVQPTLELRDSKQTLTHQRCKLEWDLEHLQVDEPRVLQQLEPLEPFNRIDKYVKASAKPGNIIAFLSHGYSLHYMNTQGALTGQ